MVEQTIYNYLSAQLSVPVYAEVPPNPPQSYVVFEKTGSNSENRIKSATIAVQSIAPSLFEAAELNTIVIEAMENMVELANISKSTLNSDYNYTDTGEKRYRYQAVFDVIYF